MRSGMKADEAFNKNDAGAVAALFTEDAVLVASDGTDYRCFTKDCFRDKPQDDLQHEEGRCMLFTSVVFWS
jgi:ketosteroid isomerase-like protein